MSKPTMGPGRFAHIRIENWKNFASVDIDIERRAFLVGPNASGKSNFLDVFRFLRDLVTTGGGFQAAVGRRGGVSAIRCLAARRYPDVVVSAAAVLADGRRWEYELVFNQDKRRVPRIKKERIQREQDVLLERPSVDDQADSERLTQTYLEQVNVNRDFRDLSQFFASVRYLHVVPQLVREPERSVGRVHDPFGGDFLEQVAKTSDKIQKAPLRRVRDALRVAVPQLADVELWRDERGTPHLRGKYAHWRPQGAWQDESQFSDGTLRLMGLLWAAMDGTGPLLIEEPELSLHPEIVRYLPQIFARIARRTGRQIFVSTHSPELLRDDGIGLDEVLLLSPGREGTSVQPAGAYDEIRKLLERGFSMSEAVIPKTRPEHAEQLLLFGDR
jgi:predicted ATPase